MLLNIKFADEEKQLIAKTIPKINKRYPQMRESDIQRLLLIHVLQQVSENETAFEEFVYKYWGGVNDLYAR